MTEPKTTKTKITLYNPVYEGIKFRGVTSDKKSKYVVTEWTVKVRAGFFYTKEEDAKKFESLTEGQTVKSVTVAPSGKFLNLVDFDVESAEEPSNEGSSDTFSQLKGFLVCLVDTVYPINQTAVVKTTTDKKVKKIKGTDLLKFQFKNGPTLDLNQLGYGYHFLPVRLVLDLFKIGFEQWCTVVGLVCPDGSFIPFEHRPTSYEDLEGRLLELELKDAVVTAKELKEVRGVGHA